MKLNELDKVGVTQQQLDTLEKVLDQVFSKVGIDIEFTRHFLDRVNDERNVKPISIKELAMLFKKEFIKYGKPIAQLGPDAEAVMKDLETDINIPFALKWNGSELELIAKTVMRKKNFRTPNKEFPVENVNEDMGTMPPLAELIVMAVVAKTTVDVIIGMFKVALKTGKGMMKINKLRKGIKSTLNKAGQGIADYAMPESISEETKDELLARLQDKQKKRFYDAAMDALHALVSAKGNRQSIGGYAFEISKSFNGISAKELEQMYTKLIGENINENISALQSELEQKYNLKSLFLSDMASRNAIELSSIIVNKDEQGSGTGSKVMQELIAYADANDKIVVLDPGLLDKQHGTTSQSRLRKFYKRFGFIDNKGRNKNYEFRNLMIRYPQTNEAVNEGYKLQLERDADMMVLNITDTATGKRTEVRGKSGYESGNYDADDKLHQLLDRIGKASNISELINGEVVGINPKHPDGKNAKAHTDVAFNESLDNPYPFKLKGPDDSQSFTATANTPNGPLTMEFSSTDFDDFGIDFSIGKSMGKTDAGDEFRVFATVVAIMKKWISTVGIEHVEGFDFGANKDEHASDGRARLYTRFAKQLASQLGWKLEQSTTGNGSTAFFRLTNPKPVPRDDEYWEQFD